MNSIRFNAEEASDFIFFPSEENALPLLKTLKLGAKKNLFSKVLKNKIEEQFDVRLNVGDKSIGKNFVTVYMLCKH